MLITAIILAGGLGTRLRSVVPDLPKPMALINDRPFLEYQLDYWIAQGIKRFILSIGYKHEIIVDYFGNHYKNAELEYVIEQTPLGTGGGLLLAAAKTDHDSSFLLLNGDTFFEVNLGKLINFAQKHDSDWCFSLCSKNESCARYMSIDIQPEGNIISLKSENKQTKYFFNGGVYWVHQRALLDYKLGLNDKISLEDYMIPRALKSNKRLFGIEFTGKFIDIGVPEDYKRASLLLI
jgi:D-glycero-alpha-D-manno-heptose 1-phosphate guanylyltransferase